MRIIIIVCCFLTACGSDQPQLQKLPADAVILAFGDSLTYGTGATEDNDYPAILQELTGLTVINEGIPGEISSRGLQRLPELLELEQPDLLILIHGGNDILRQVPERQSIENLRQMIQLAREQGSQVMIVGVPKPKLLMMESAPVYQQIAEEMQVVADLETLPTILADSDLKSDRVHPNDEGYRVMAENIAELLKQRGGI